MVDLPEPDRPVNQRHRGYLMLLIGAGCLVEFQCLPMDIAGPPQGEVDHARTHGLEAQLVDQDERPHGAVDAIRLEHHRCTRR